MGTWIFVSSIWILSAEQDPFDCIIDLEKDGLWGTELIRKHIEVSKIALTKRDPPMKNSCY